MGEYQKRDERGVRKSTYKRYKDGEDYTSPDAAQTAALCDMMRIGIFGEIETPDGERVRGKGGRPRKIATVEELQEGIENYINYIADQTAKGIPLVPDVEGLALFLGVSRATLWDWQRSRPGAFSDTLKTAINAIAAYKKQLALTGRIPPIVFATDFNNNHGYVQQQKIEVQSTKKLDDLPQKADIISRLPVKNAGSLPVDMDVDIDLGDDL